MGPSLITYALCIQSAFSFVLIKLLMFECLQVSHQQSSLDIAFNFDYLYRLSLLCLLHLM